MAKKRYAILIGSSRYPDEPGLTELRCPENDVDALDAVLCSPDFGCFTETFVFKNRPSHEILEKIETVLADAGRDDLVLIYFSGHGKTSIGPLCLATANTKMKALGSTSIPVAMIKTFFDSSDTRKKVLILDCCFSGSAGKIFTKGGLDDQLRVISEGEGTFIMTASATFQAAFEKEGDQYSLFTKHLVEGIRTGEADKDEDGLVDMQELYEYVHDKVQGEEGAQEPMKWDLHVKGRMVVSRSGKVPREKQLREAKSTLFRLAAEERLTESIVFEAVNVLAIPKQEMTPRDQKCSLLVRQLVSAKINPPVFMEQWLRTCLAHPAVPEPKKKAVISVEPALVVPSSPKPQENRTIGRYIDHGNGTVTDAETGLMWKRCLEGLSGVNCEEGKVERYTWNEAVKRFKNVEYAGYADWRLPTIDELETLVYCSKGKDKKGDCKDGSEKPTINQQAFPNTETSNVWSGSPNADYSGYAWSVYFYNGSSYIGFRSSNYAVRLLRDGQ